MSFFEDKAGRLYPIVDIERISPSEGPTQSAIVEMKSGSVDYRTSIEIWPSEFDRLRNLGRPYIPAAPGSLLLVFCYDPSEIEAGSNQPAPPMIERHPIAGWRVGDFDGLEGVAPGVDKNLVNDRGILLSSGVVISEGGDRYETVEDWSQAMQNCADDEEASRQKRIAVKR